MHATHTISWSGIISHSGSGNVTRRNTTPCQQLLARKSLHGINQNHLRCKFQHTNHTFAAYKCSNNKSH